MYDRVCMREYMRVCTSVLSHGPLNLPLQRSGPTTIVQQRWTQDVGGTGHARLAPEKRERRKRKGKGGKALRVELTVEMKSLR